MSTGLKVREARERLRRITDRLDALVLLWPKMDNGEIEVGNLIMRDDEIGIFLQIAGSSGSVDVMLLGDKEATIVMSPSEEATHPSAGDGLKH